MQKKPHTSQPVPTQTTRYFSSLPKPCWRGQTLRPHHPHATVAPATVTSQSQDKQSAVPVAKPSADPASTTATSPTTRPRRTLRSGPQTIGDELMALEILQADDTVQCVNSLCPAEYRIIKGGSLENLDRGALSGTWSTVELVHTYDNLMVFRGQISIAELWASKELDADAAKKKARDLRSALSGTIPAGVEPQQQTSGGKQVYNNDGEQDEVRMSDEEEDREDEDEGCVSEPVIKRRRVEQSQTDDDDEATQTQTQESDCPALTQPDQPIQLQEEEEEQQQDQQEEQQQDEQQEEEDISHLTEVVCVQKRQPEPQEEEQRRQLRLEDRLRGKEKQICEEGEDTEDKDDNDPSGPLDYKILYRRNGQLNIRYARDCLQAVTISPDKALSDLREALAPDLSKTEYQFYSDHGVVPVTRLQEATKTVAEAAWVMPHPITQEKRHVISIGKHETGDQRVRAKSGGAGCKKRARSTSRR
eukprot:TRINITY_DN7033_c0_g1_i1.p1 TRINITY_DN7033_c0_g1~~TRINITY_DN7033_c0_g1_i1.p1  ORF type:complete len:475 (+),score=81.78 TRINITY_DN7033_c0_g1_i1:113-1537(+)